MFWCTVFLVIYWHTYNLYNVFAIKGLYEVDKCVPNVDKGPRWTKCYTTCMCAIITKKKTSIPKIYEIKQKKNKKYDLKITVHYYEGAQVVQSFWF